MENIELPLTPAQKKDLQQRLEKIINILYKYRVPFRDKLAKQIAINMLVEGWLSPAEIMEAWPMNAKRLPYFDTHNMKDITPPDDS